MSASKLAPVWLSAKSRQKLTIATAQEAFVLAAFTHVRLTAKCIVRYEGNGGADADSRG